MKTRTHLNDRVVVITGASAGVGRATAQAFAKEGARIGLIARGHAGLEGAKKDVERLGGKAIVLPLDVANAGAAEAAAAKIESEFSSIDVWVNNAMAERWLRSNVCCRAIAELSFRSDRLWLIAEFRCKRLTVQPSMRFRDSAIRCVAN